MGEPGRQLPGGVDRSLDRGWGFAGARHSRTGPWVSDFSSYCPRGQKRWVGHAFVPSDRIFSPPLPPSLLSCPLPTLVMGHKRAQGLLCLAICPFPPSIPPSCPTHVTFTHKVLAHNHKTSQTNTNTNTNTHCQLASCIGSHHGMHSLLSVTSPSFDSDSCSLFHSAVGIFEAVALRRWYRWSA